MSIEIAQNGVAAAAIVTTSWVRDEYASGRKRFTLYAMQVPVAQAVNPAERIEAARPRLAGAPMVIGQAVIEAPNLDVAKLLHAAIGEMLQKQGPEIIQVAGR